jgi:transposase
VRRFVEANELVFVDECGTNIALTRLCARAPKGERAYGKAPRNWGKNVTLIAAMSAQGMGASMSVEGATDGSAFQTYVEHFLLPTLKKGQVVVMDNLQVHKSSRVRKLIEGVGASVLFLPAYSPDFSPIEEAFSKIKGILRTIEARTHETLVEAIGIALQAVSRQDALGWFGHCASDVTDQSL